MPYKVTLHRLEDLAKADDGNVDNEILLDTKPNTELHIRAEKDRTIIMFPFGNRFDIIDGRIIVYEK